MNEEGILISSKVTGVAYEMAYSKNFVEYKTQDYSRTIFEHLVKIFAFGVDSEDYPHWVFELADHLADINLMKVKISSRKLKAEDYKEHFLDAFGETEDDVLLLVKMYSKRNDRDKRYPHFEPTRELAHKVYVAAHSMFDAACPLISTINKLTVDDFMKVVDKALHSV